MALFGLLILLLFWQNQRSSGSRSLDTRLFNGILLATMLEQLMDAGQWLLDGAFFPGSRILQVFCYTVGYMVAPFITCLWALYCDLRANMDERALKRRAPLYAVPLMMNTLLLIANLFTPLVFRIDAGNMYHRDQFFWVYMALMYFYGLLSMAMVLRKAAKTESVSERREFRYMGLFIIPPVLGGVLQWMFYGLSLVWMCATLSIVLVYINVLSRQISTDTLTGLNNRRQLNRYLDLKINSAEANENTFLVMLDADGFKGINDVFGHAAGDRALIAMADVLKKSCAHQECFLARLGGDEFVIVGEEKDAFRPASLAETITAQVTEFNRQTREPFQLSISAGWAYFQPGTVNTADALLMAADESMYVVKEGKRTRLPRPRRFHQRG